MALAPILVFLALYLGSGITFEYILKIENGFYQTPAIVIFLIALAVACFQNRKLDFNAKLKVMATGVADENILTMCLVFLAAGAFSGAISAAGGADSTVYLFLTLSLIHILGQHLLGGLGLVILFIVLGGVLLWGEQRVQADVHLCPLRVIKVRSTQTPHSPVHLVEVGGEDIPQLPQPLPVLGGLQLLLLVSDLPGGAVPGGGHGADEILAPLLDALQVLPLLVEAVQQLRERGKVLQRQAALVLSGGKEGKSCV